MTDKIKLSYHDACLYQSDYQILKSNSWLNDRIISFYFEYLQREIVKDEKILFIGEDVKNCSVDIFHKFHSSQLIFLFQIIGPEVTQILKIMETPSEVLGPLQCLTRSLIILAVSDNSSIDSGGSHWSLCVFSKANNAFYHFDSLSGSNTSHFLKIVSILKKCLDCESAKTEHVSCTQQNNSYMCGDFVCCHTDLVLQTFEKSGNLTAIGNLPRTKVNGKRDEIVQIVTNLDS